MVTIIACGCLLVAALIVARKLDRMSNGAKQLAETVRTLSDSFGGVQRSLARLESNFTVPHPDTLPSLPPVTEPGKRRKKK